MFAPAIASYALRYGGRKGPWYCLCVPMNRMYTILYG